MDFALLQGKFRIAIALYFNRINRSKNFLDIIKYHKIVLIINRLLNLEMSNFNGLF